MRWPPAQALGGRPLHGTTLARSAPTLDLALAGGVGDQVGQGELGRRGPRNGVQDGVALTKEAGSARRGGDRLGDDGGPGRTQAAPLAEGGRPART